MFYRWRGEQLPLKRRPTQHYKGTMGSSKRRAGRLHAHAVHFAIAHLASEGPKAPLALSLHVPLTLGLCFTRWWI